VDKRKECDIHESGGIGNKRERKEPSRFMPGVAPIWDENERGETHVSRT
jgi:hypothetical protein